ncbi:MAG: hypothetical protein QF690_05760, partial [Anaerolineales bacterium]|nr:hypothetical protein [Anaerolineales bacterium]
ARASGVDRQRVGNGAKSIGKTVDKTLRLTKANGRHMTAIFVPSGTFSVQKKAKKWTQRDSNPRPSRLQFEPTAGTLFYTITARNVLIHPLPYTADYSRICKVF